MLADADMQFVGVWVSNVESVASLLVVGCRGENTHTRANTVADITDSELALTHSVLASVLGRGWWKERDSAQDPV